MATSTRRSSARIAASRSPSPSNQQNVATNGDSSKKRKAPSNQSSQEASSPKAKKGRTEESAADTSEKQQTKLEDFTNNGSAESNAHSSDEHMNDVEVDEEINNESNKSEDVEDGKLDHNEVKNGEESTDVKTIGEGQNDIQEKGSENNSSQQKESQPTSKAQIDHDAKQKNDPQPSASDGGAVEESKERKDAIPSNILEKGVVYFFVRGRVGIDEPQGVQDVARSYFVLRPLPHGAKLGDGPIEDLKNNRLCALPKKVLPRGPKDAFMAFIEKSKITIADLKKDFMEGSTYETKTTGVRHSPNVTPVGEGVYAITSSGRSSHLAYMLTIPSEIGEVQKELGLEAQGSFILSVKNPDSSAPATQALPQGTRYSEELMKEFRGRAWAPLQPAHLDYDGSAFLLVGEGHGDLGGAVEPMEKEKNDDTKESPREELEQLQGEDGKRVDGLKEDDAVFEDLGISKKDYPKVQTTW